MQGDNTSRCVRCYAVTDNTKTLGHCAKCVLAVWVEQSDELAALRAELASEREKREAAERERDEIGRRSAERKCHYELDETLAREREAKLTEERDNATALLRDVRKHLNAEQHPAQGEHWIAKQIHDFLTASAAPEGECEEICPACSGSGVIEQGPVDGQCQRCSGTGTDARIAELEGLIQRYIVRGGRCVCCGVSIQHQRHYSDCELRNALLHQRVTAALAAEPKT